MIDSSVGDAGVGDSGVRIATASGGAGDMDAFFLHANGFCKEVLQPMIDLVEARINPEPFTWVSADLRGHGASGVGPLPNEWGLLSKDITGVLDGRVGAVGVGHSIGGSAIARVEALHQGTFRHLVLIEPIIFPSTLKRDWGFMSENAIRRRRSFPSRDAAYERFNSGPFSSWDTDALAAYIDHGFMETGDGWELRCSPEVEADFYAEWLNHDTWDRVGEIEAPVTLIAGEYSETHTVGYLDALSSRFLDVEVVVIDGAGHLVPMEDPDSVARLVASAIKQG